MHQESSTLHESLIPPKPIPAEARVFSSRIHGLLDGQPKDEATVAKALEGMDDMFGPAGGTGRELVHHPVVVRPAIRGIAIQITAAIKDQALRSSSVVSAGERVEDALGPCSSTRRQFKNRAGSVVDSSAEGCSIQISRSIEDNAVARSGAVGAALEAVDHALGIASASCGR